MIDWVMRSHKVSFCHACELLLKEHPALAAAAVAGASKKISQGKLRQAQSFAVPAAAGSAAEAAADQVLLDQVIDFYHDTLKGSPEALAYLDRRGAREDGADREVQAGVREPDAGVSAGRTRTGRSRIGWRPGYRNVTSCYRVNGFTDKLLAALKAAGAQRILIAFDRDEAGDRAAEALVKKLQAAGLDCFRLLFPKGMDANAYATSVKPPEKSLGVVIRSAEWLGAGAGLKKPKLTTRCFNRVHQWVNGDEILQTAEGLRPAELRPVELPASSAAAESAASPSSAMVDAEPIPLVAKTVAADPLQVVDETLPGKRPATAPLTDQAAIRAVGRGRCCDDIFLIRERDGRVEACQQIDEHLAVTADEHRQRLPPVDGDGSALHRLHGTDRDLSIAIDQVVEVRQWWKLAAHAAAALWFEAGAFLRDEKLLERIVEDFRAGGARRRASERAPDDDRTVLTTIQLTIVPPKHIINHMVDARSQLDTVFHALSDSTRRSILQRLAGGGALVKDLAAPFAMSKQAVSKHLHVLEEAGLVVKVAEGRSTTVKLRPETLRQVEDWVSFYRGFWTDSLVALADIVDGEEETGD